MYVYTHENAIIWLLLQNLHHSGRCQESYSWPPRIHPENSQPKLSVIKPQVLRQKEYTVESNSIAYLQLGSVKESKIKFHVKQLIPAILFYFHPPSNYCPLFRYHLKKTSIPMKWPVFFSRYKLRGQGLDLSCLAIFYVKYILLNDFTNFVVQLPSGVRLFVTLWTDGSTPGCSVPHYLCVYSNSCPLSQWCHPTSSSSAAPFSFCLQYSPASGYFPMSQLFTSGGQNIYEYWTQIK